MERDTLIQLEELNQLRLDESEEAEVIGFFAQRDSDLAELEAIDTQDVERMVHVMPLENVLREDVVIESFSRESLQEGAPMTEEGYWQVPRTVE